MYTISMGELPAFLKHVAVRLREPVMIWGPPGVGKSEGVGQVFQNDQLVDIRLSQYDSVDLRGLPMPSEGLTVWHMPSTLPFKGNPRFDASLPVIGLFLDEINSAAAAVSAVAYQLINDRRVGEHVLMDNVVVIAAGNREGDKGVTNRMPLPLANRFTHVEVGVSADSWCLWAQDAKLPPIGIAFMQFRKPLLSTFDPAKPQKAFATPRTWAKALRYYADDQMPEAVKMAAMAGAIGEGPAAEFWGFVDVWAKLTPIAKIIAAPDKVKVPEEASMRYAMAINVSGSLSLENAAPLYQYLTRMDAEFMVLAWSMALKRDTRLWGSPEFIAFSKAYRGVFTA